MEQLYEIEPCFDLMVQHINKMAKFNQCERIYFGSSFCGQYFLHLSDQLIEALMIYCQSKKVHVTLVVPIFTEKHLKKGKEKIANILERYKACIDEVTINDYGMLLYIHETYQEIKLNMGRLFMKDYREPRYEEYFNETLYPRGFTQYLNKIIKAYQITGIEFDPTHRSIDFSEKPKGVEIGIYAPYAYITVGQICQVGGMHKPIEKKFRPNEPCSVECYKHRMKYFIGDERDWLRVGRAIYFKNEAPEIRGLSSYREIYAPLDWEVKA